MMKENEQNFDELKRLLKLKQCEIPPPGYFNHFSDKVVARIRAGEAGNSGTAYERLQSHAPWLAKFLAVFDAKPAVIGTFATGLCLLLVIGVVVTSKTEMNSDNSIAVAGGAATAGPRLSLASVTAPILADAGGGIQISTNPVSLQPMTALFGQDNPLLHSVSFGH